MARPQKQTVDYFPHDASASQGDTLTILQGKWGNDGYAFWFRLLEKLCSSKGHFIDCRNPVKWQLLLAKTQLSNGTGEEIMDTLVDLQAIDSELWKKNRIIWCQNLVDNIGDAYRNRRRPVPTRPVPTDINPITTVSNPHTILKETKEETKLKKESGQFDIFWKAYPRRKSKGQAEKVFEKIDPDEQLFKIILTAIEKAKKSVDWQKDNGQFIPYPATWLNARGWEDELKGDRGGAHKGSSRQLIERNSYTRPDED
jgi:hypothetical protein